MAGLSGASVAGTAARSALWLQLWACQLTGLLTAGLDYRRRDCLVTSPLQVGFNNLRVSRDQASACRKVSL